MRDDNVRWSLGLTWVNTTIELGVVLFWIISLICVWPHLKAPLCSILKLLTLTPAVVVPKKTLCQTALLLLLTTISYNSVSNQCCIKQSFHKYIHTCLMICVFFNFCHHTYSWLCVYDGTRWKNILGPSSSNHRMTLQNPRNITEDMTLESLL